MRPICEVYNRMKEMYDDNTLWWLYVTLHTDFASDEHFRKYVYKHTSTVPTVKRVIFNPPATIIMWSDNTKSVVKCQDGEPFDPEKGFVLAYLKKLLGNDNTFNKEIHKWVKYEEPVEKKKEETEWKVVNRPVQAGDYIRITHPCFSFNTKGDILKVAFVRDSGLAVVYAKDHPVPTGVFDDYYEWNYLKSMYKIVEDATNEPLTLEELMEMDGQQVWLSSLRDGVENFDDWYCGWRTVNVANQEVRRSTGFYSFSEMNEDYGFRAYRKPPKQAKVGNEHE